MGGSKMKNQLTIKEAIKDFSYETPMALALYHMNVIYCDLLKNFSDKNVKKITRLKTRFISKGAGAFAYLKGFINRRYPETAHFFDLKQETVLGLTIIEITHKS